MACCGPRVSNYTPTFGGGRLGTQVPQPAVRSRAFPRPCEKCGSPASLQLRWKGGAYARVWRCGKCASEWEWTE